MLFYDFLTADRFDQFWSVNKKLMERLNGEPFKYIPFKIYQVLLQINYMPSLQCTHIVM